MKFCDNCKNKGAWCPDCMWNGYYQNLFEAVDEGESKSPYFKIQSLLERFTRYKFNEKDYFRMEWMLKFNYSMYEISDMIEFLKQTGYGLRDFVENPSSETFLVDSEIEQGLEKISKSIKKIKEVERELHCTLTKAGIDRVLDMDRNGFNAHDCAESFTLL